MNERGYLVYGGRSVFLALCIWRHRPWQWSQRKHELEDNTIILQSGCMTCKTTMLTLNYTTLLFRELRLLPTDWGETSLWHKCWRRYRRGGSRMLIPYSYTNRCQPLCICWQQVYQKTTPFSGHSSVTSWVLPNIATAPDNPVIFLMTNKN